MLERLLQWFRRRSKTSRPALSAEEIAERKRVLERRYERLKRTEHPDVNQSDS